MPTCCGVVKCGNRSERNYKSFFRLPAVLTKGSEFKRRLSAQRREKWLLALRRADLNDSKRKWMRICGDHFISGRPAKLLDVKNPDWIPSQKMGYHKDIPKIRKRKSTVKKTVQIKKEVTELQPAPDPEPVVYCENIESYVACNVELTTATQCVESPIDVPLDSQALETHETEEYPLPNPFYETEQTTPPETCEIQMVLNQSVECQTDFTREDIYNIERAYMDTIKELIDVREKASKLSISEDTFRNDDERTKYYTGLQNFTALMMVFNIVQNDLPQAPGSSLTKFQQFILTLMRLKLNLDFNDLAYRFAVSRSTVARIFPVCVDIMYKRLGRFLVWPSRDKFVKEVPHSFVEAVGHKVVVILSSFEEVTEKPAYLTLSALTASKYMENNTIKFLIGICPQGSVVFISSAWAGNTPDEQIVENCGILEHLAPDDIVICDKGFNVDNQAKFYCEVIKIPEKDTKNRKILSGIQDVDRNNFFGVNFTKHVWRVVGKLKQYRILQRTMPLSTSPNSGQESPALIDQIVKVCCALINISSLVIPVE